jgi:hypothetical protein
MPVKQCIRIMLSLVIHYSFLINWKCQFSLSLLYEIFANFHVLLNHSFYTKDAAPQWFDHAQNPKFWCVVFMFRYI